MKLIAIEPIKVGGKRVAPGTAFECDDKVGEQLLAAGAAQSAADAKAKAKAEAGQGGVS